MPYILFAYRDVPQESTGFSPFELVYGRDVRTPLELLKDSYLPTVEKPDDIATYVMRARERLEKAREAVDQNIRQQQIKQKQWYDRRARQSPIAAGDQVLLLLPRIGQKFKREWKGPYTVKKQMGPVNYEVEIPDQQTTKVYHVNLLKKWFPRREPERAYVHMVTDEQEELPCVQQDQQDLGSATYGEQLTEEQKAQVTEVISQFPQISQQQPGRTTELTHRIVTTDQQPIRLRPYRIPPAVKDDVVSELQELLKSGIVEESTSEWAAPIVVVKKKDGTNRICVDYRKLNTITKFDAYPMPRIDEMLDAVGKAQYITTLDLAKGYWQVPLEDTDREKTAFTSPIGLLQFCVMPFGLSGAPATFQRLMDRVLRGLGDFVGVYLDDIIIYSETWDDHLHHLCQVLQRINDANLTLKLKKCSFGTQECTYLGHRIGCGGVRPEESKVKAVQDICRPQTKKEVRSFLGLTGYYRRFIKDYATIATPLTDLTKKGEPEQVKWTDQCENAFQTLKKALTSATLLRNPDFSQTFQLQTDASDTGIGAVLSQGGDQDQPIAYYSRKLLDRERNYSTIEKECLAVLLGIKAFETYLIGHPFILQTDNRALKWLQQFKDKNMRLTRWSLALQPYTFTVQHRKGKENGNADALSRLSCPPVLRTQEGGESVAKEDLQQLEDQLQVPAESVQPDRLGSSRISEQ